MPFSRRSCWPRNWTQVSCVAGRFFTIWATRETHAGHQSVQSLSPVRLFVTPWTAAHQASLSITSSWSLFKLISIESVMLSNNLILCCPLLLLPSIFPGIRVFSNKSVLHRSGQSIGISASVQFSFSLVTQSCPTLCDPRDCSMSGFLVHYQLPELSQIHVHRVGDAIQPSHPLSSPSPHTFNLSENQSLFFFFCHIRMMGFIFSFHFQIFYDCVCQFYNCNYNYTTYKILAFYIRLLITTSFMIMEFYLGLK